MTTLDELKDYLNIQNPAGAVMVTGKWGCGKTYFVEHDFRNDIKEKWIVIKVSLFGITDKEDINAAVNKNWLEALLDEYKVKKITDMGNRILNVFKDLPFPDQIKELMKIDPTKYVMIENRIGDKKVVIVFDDFERCRMNIVDILGCINSYCENQHFHTIIIANEERIHDMKAGEVSTSDLSDASSQLVYSEIKEKIILRTLYYKPNYEAIIESIIKESLPYYNDKEYGIYISNNSKRIASLFVDAEYVFMNNIRCTKCALQDFSRVYRLLCDNDIKDIENWLDWFFVFEAAVRNGIVQKKEGKQAAREFRELYKDSFTDIYFICGIVDWIVRGVWDAHEIDKEIAHIKEIQSLNSDCDRLRLGCILKLEDSVIRNGFGKLLGKAYQGDISLDDYLNLIKNYAMARWISYPIETEIDFEQLKIGLNICFRRINANEMKDNCLIEVPYDQSLYERYYDNEIHVFESIYWFRKEQNSEKNSLEKQFINIMSKGIVYLKNNYTGLKINYLTMEMINIIYDEFSSCDNDAKFGFSSVFRHIFEDLQVTRENIEALEQLYKSLDKLEKTYGNNNYIAMIHTRDLRHTVVELLSKINSKYERENHKGMWGLKKQRGMLDDGLLKMDDISIFVKDFDPNKYLSYE